MPIPRAYRKQDAPWNAEEPPECPECSTEFVREVSDESHTLDLDGRE